jgi:hypothetical protein
MKTDRLNEIIRINVLMFRSYMKDARSAEGRYAFSSPSAYHNRAAGIASVLRDLTEDSKSCPALLEQFHNSSLLRTAEPAAATATVQAAA